MICILATTVSAGDDWQHEIKFDGSRVQIHKLGDEIGDAADLCIVFLPSLGPQYPQFLL